MCWCRVEIPVEFFDVLAMITLMSSDAKKALLEDAILPVPQRERQTHALAIIGDPGNTVFSPSISSRTCMLVGKVIPSIAVVRIVLSNGCLCTKTHSRQKFPGGRGERDSPIACQKHMGPISSNGPPSCDRPRDDTARRHDIRSRCAAIGDLDRGWCNGLPGRHCQLRRGRQVWVFLMAGQISSGGYWWGYRW